MDPTEKEDADIFNALQANPGVIDSLSEDEAAELEQAVARHQARQAKAVPAQKPAPIGGGLSQGSPQEYEAGTHDRVRTANAVYGQPEAAKAVRAFGSGLVPFYTSMSQIGADDPELVRQQHEAARREYPMMQTAGNMVQAVGLTPPGAGQVVAKIPSVLGRMKAVAAPSAGIAGINYLTNQSNEDPNAPAKEIVPKLGATMALGAMGGAATERFIEHGTLFDELAKKVGPRSAKGVLDWTDAFARESIADPETVMTLQKQPSTKGFGNAYEDVLYELSANIIPEGPVAAATQTPYSARQAALKNLATGEEAINLARDPMRVDVPDADLMTAMTEGARDLRLRGQAGGEDAARLIEQQRDLLVGTNKLGARRPGDPAWTGQTNLGELETIGTGISNPEFEAGLGTANPKISTGMAKEKLAEIQAFEAAKQTGDDPMKLIAQGDIANEYYAPKRKAAEITFGNDARTALPASPGFASDSALGMGTRSVLQVVKGRISRGIVGGSKKALAWAHKRLQNLSGPNQLIPENEAPFQLDAFRRQVEAIDSLDPNDATAAIYALSMTDPQFAVLWRKSQEDENE